MIESLRATLLAERRRNLVQEMEIRREMGDAMLQQLVESEELRKWVKSIVGQCRYLVVCRSYHFFDLTGKLVFTVKRLKR